MFSWETSMFVSKNQELCQSSTSHPHHPRLTFLFLYIVFVVLLEGLDAVQIAVANRDCLSSPPFINKSAQLGRLSAAATKEQQAGLSLHSEAFHVCPSLLFLCIFLPPPRLPPSLTIPPLTLPVWVGLDHWLLLVWIRQGSSVSECARLQFFLFFFFEKSFQRSLGVGDRPCCERGERGDPLLVLWFD